MKKENKEMLKAIIKNQEMIMKALKIEIPVKVIKKAAPKKVVAVKKVAVKLWPELNCETLKQIQVQHFFRKLN